MTESLRELYGRLHEERLRTLPPEDVEANVRQRRELEDSYDPAGSPAVGSRLDNFVFTDVQGGDFSLDDVVANGPAVLVVFRFAGCPACNIALPYYQRNLWPRLEELEIPLVAISPQVPGPLGEIRSRHDLSFTVASDPDNRFSRYLGITYAPNATTRAYLERKGLDLSAVIGTSNDELPQATTIVIDRDRTVRFIDVTPDWLARTEAGPLLGAVDALVVATSA